MEGTVDVPGAGHVKKKYVVGIAGAVGAYVIFAYYRATRAAKDSAAQTPVDPAFGDGEVLPTVPGAYTPGGGGIAGDAEPPSTDQFGFHGTTNSQWTQYAATQLSQSAVWEYTDIITALGQFLNNRPLTAQQQQIVQSAIAVAGYPPEGSHVIIPGGDVVNLVAPTGLSATAVNDTTVTVKWSAVAGAAGYQVYRGGSMAASVNTTSATVAGLTASTAYSFTVAAFNAAGTLGPMSGAVSVTTKAKPVVTPPKTTTPAPKPTPKPAGPGAYDVITVTATGQTLSGLISAYNKKHGTHHTVDEVWAYNQKWRPKDTAAKLAKQGKNLIYRGQSFWVPK
ncbi:fibronectin type III domain-containing protein [Streptomyces sp. NPDC001251]